MSGWIPSKDVKQPAEILANFVGVIMYAFLEIAPLFVSPGKGRLEFYDDGGNL